MQTLTLSQQTPDTAVLAKHSLCGGMLDSKILESIWVDICQKFTGHRVLLKQTARTEPVTLHGAEGHTAPLRSPRACR